MLEDYSNLPDYMPCSDIENFIDKILDTENNNSITSKIEVANALLEMMHRQANNYTEKLEERILHRMQKWIVDSWCLSSPDLIDLTSTIIVNLEDQAHFPQGLELLEFASQSNNKEVRLIAQEALAEIRN